MKLSLVSIVDIYLLILACDKMPINHIQFSTLGRSREFVYPNLKLQLSTSPASEESERLGKDRVPLIHLLCVERRLFSGEKGSTSSRLVYFFPVDLSEYHFGSLSERITVTSFLVCFSSFTYQIFVRF
jgi:hypothetical protein